MHSCILSFEGGGIILSLGIWRVKEDSLLSVIQTEFWTRIDDFIMNGV